MSIRGIKKIIVPKFPFTEYTYRWLETILEDRFGGKWHLERTSQGLSMSLEGENGVILFDMLQDCFTEAQSNLPFTYWNAELENWQMILEGPIPTPGVSSLKTPLIEKLGSDHIIHYDILGLTYWMLTRLEEIDRNDLDAHGRFPATSSHAFKHGYLDRPIVDEWMHLLGEVIKRQWQGIKLKRNEKKIFVTCDVDKAYQFDFSTNVMFRDFAGDVIKRRNPLEAIKKLRTRLRYRRDDFEGDLYLENIEWMMDVNEKAGNRVAFYFITGGSHHLDPFYHIDQPALRRLLKRIYERGHEIGLHPSYMTYLDSGKIQREADTLRNVLNEEGIQYSQLGGRQHYLRWQTSDTARNLEDAGMDYDSTLSYAEQSGFRCGTSHEFKMFDAEKGRILNLWQRPLILMECSVIDDTYMGLGYSDEALNYMQTLKSRSLISGGSFTMLWHNTDLKKPSAYTFYEEIIQS